MALKAKDIFIVAAKRTPFGTFGGKLKALTATDMAVHAAKAAIQSANVDPKLIDSCIVGNVAHTSTDAAYISRHVGLRSGLRDASTALTVNRLCGSGFQAVVSGAYEMMGGENPNGLALVGGSESMSQAPLAVFGQHVRFGHRLGQDLQLQDTLWQALTDSYAATPMGMTAENLALKYGITRKEVDDYAVRSQKAWAAAQAAGIYQHEVAPIEVKGKKGPETMDKDEHPRPETTIESVSKLTPVFKKDGVVTAAGSSGICDGAAMMVLADGDAVRKHGLKPLARVAGWAVSGVDPKIMGIGPAPAIKALLSKTGRKLDELDVIELNEAFAAQVLAVEKDLGLRREQHNIHGGAIALGHPLGASGARITGHVAHMLAQSGGKKKWGVGAACIGGGQGIAILLENAA